MHEGSQRIGFFGLGKSNLSLMTLERFKGCRLTIRSDVKINRNALPSGLNIEKICEGPASTESIDEEILFFSPSVRRERVEFTEASKRGVVFSSDAELFFRENNQPVFAVTGSDGKSTTATLTHLLFSEGGCKSRLIGNIGEGMCKNLGFSGFYVCELSSFMLTYLTPKVKRAAITGITPNHLDWHKDFDEYKMAKLSLLQGTEESVLTDEFRCGYIIVSAEKSLNELKTTHRAQHFITLEGGFILRDGRKILPISEIVRREKYNLINLMLAIGMTDGYVDEESIRRVAGNFTGLAHRCELVLYENGVDYYNSSIDSSPSRTISTVKALDRRLVIILGGKSKGLDYSELLPCLKKYAEHIILTGENSGEIYSAIRELNPIIVQDFSEAVLLGKEIAQGVGTLLLSPASTSYDKFENYEERGRFFKEILSKSTL